MSDTSRVWLVTGCSSGFGAEFIRNVLRRGERAIATGRNAATLAPLASLGAATLELDINGPYDALVAKANEAVAIYGRVDVLVNNAGYGQLGAFEDVGPEALQKQFQTLVFGPVHLTNALLPHFRANNNSGTILVISSIAGIMNMAGVSAYTSAKAAVDSLFAGLALELASTNIRTLVAQPGGFRTSILTAENLERDQLTTTHHKELMAGINESMAAQNGQQPGDPAKFVDVLVDLVVAGEHEGKPWPHKLLFGSDAVDGAKDIFAKNSAWVEEWEAVSRSTDLPQ